MPNAKTKRIAVAAVLALGAALRLWGLGFGLPIVSNFYVRPDESLLVQAAVGFFERYGNPQFFAYPALLTELSAMLFLPLPGEFATEPSTYFLAVRVLSALAGIATVGVVYLLARGFCDWKWSLAAAALFAVAPLPVRDAHFGVTDTLLTLLVALTLLLATRPVRKEESGTGVWIWTSLVFGLAVSTKYTAVFAAPAIVAAAFARGGPLRRTARDLAAAGAIAAAVFFVLNPYVLLRMGEVAATILEMLRVFYGGTQALPESHWSWSGAAMQLLRPLLWGPGSWLGFVLAAASLPWLRRASAARGLWTLALGVFPFLLVFLPFRHPLPFRYILPALPGLAVLAVFAVSRLASRKALVVPLVALGIAVLGWQLAESIALVRTLAREDTRTQAGLWIAANLPQTLPVVLLTAPEAEPQIAESAASLERRIRYAYRLYGERSGEIVSELYRRILPGAREGYEVYRNPAPADVPGEEFLLVTAEYPMRTGGQSAQGRVAEFGEVRERVEFDPVTGSMEGASLDPSDAFYLPMNPAGRVTRPGPRLRMFWMRRARLP